MASSSYDMMSGGLDRSDDFGSRGAATCRLGTPARAGIAAVIVAVAAVFSAGEHARAAPATAANAVDEPKPDPSAAAVFPQLPAAPGADRSATFEVLVVDKADGRPIPGATVRFYTDPGEVRAVTDEDGVARIPRPKAGNYGFTGDAWAEGYQSKRQRWSNEDPRYKPLSGRVMFSLDKGELTISGRVVDEGGRPIPGVVVELQGMREGETALAFFDVARVTDTDGRWSTSSMPKTLSSIGGSFHHPDYYHEHTQGAFTLGEVKDGTQVTVLKRGVRVEGRVVDEDGRPIAGAEIVVPRRLGIPTEDAAQGDANGRFLFPSAFKPVESKTMLTWAPGRAPLLSEIRPEPGQAPLEIRLMPGRTIRGRAVDSKGRPVADARVVAGQWSGWSWSKILTITDRDGRFTFDGAPSDGVQISIGQEGYKTAVLVVTPSDTEYTWTLTPTLSVRLAVKDAATGTPIKRFSIERGQLGEDGMITWETPTGRERSVELFGRGYAQLDASAPGWKLRVVAQGYRPAETRTIENDEGRVELDVAIERLAPGEGGGPTGVILGPDGKPLAGAEVMLATRSQGASLNDGSWWYGQGGQAWSGAGTVLTDDQGRFTFLPTGEPYSLGAVHELGYGEVTDIQPRKDDGVPIPPREIRIQPWGRIEGRVLVGARPLAEQEVGYSTDEPIMMLAPLNAHGRTTTDADGRFAFERVPPGPVEVRYSTARHLANRAFADVPPIGTARVHVGGTGRPLVGRISWPEGADPTRTLGGASVGLSTDKKQIPYPEKQGYEEQVAWLKRWWTSPEGIRHRNGYVLRGTETKPDGSIRFDDVAPGNLVLNVEVQATVDGRRLTIAKAERKVRVPEIPGGRSNEPIDLGTIELTMPPLPVVLKVGEEAPAFEAKRLDGRPLKLSDYRGMFVLLDFWATWCGPCLAEVPHLKAVHDAFGHDERFALVSLSLDDESDTVREYLKIKDQPWTQGFLGNWADDPVTKGYGIESIPQILLIGPDGKIVARNLRGEAILETVRGALQGAR